MALDYHALSLAADAGAGLPQATTDIVSNTDRRDVSEVLDLFAPHETPFINRIGWGSESGSTSIEWLTENLGPAYVAVGSVHGSAGTSILITTVSNMSLAETAKQLQTGTLLYHYSSTDTAHSLYLVVSTGSDGEIEIEVVETTTTVWSVTGSTTAGDNLYILGALANEGSVPKTGNWRARALASNGFTIMRQDVQITGSQKANDFYAIGREDSHQMKMRMIELVRDRERSALYSVHYTPRTTTAASLMNGCMGFLASQSGNHINTDTTLTETGVNDVVSELWENGSTNLVWFSNMTQARKFTQWDINRIRMDPRDERGGGHVARYQTEAGPEIEIVAMRHAPPNMAFLIDTSKCRMRAKKGRKGIMEKLGKRGDFDEWQIISEFSMEMRKYNQGCHGMFSRLS